MFKLHFKRAITNRNSKIVFLLVLLVNVAIALSDILRSSGVPFNYLYDFPGYVLGTGQDMKFRNYFQFHEVYAHVFVLLLAVLPYAGSFFDDRNYGVVNSIFSRANCLRYYGTGLATNYVVSFITYFVPRMLVVSMLAIAFPPTHQKIGFTDLNFVGGDFYYVAFLRDLLLYQPYVYFLITAIIASVYVANFSTIVYTLSLHIKKNKYVLLLSPVLITFIFDAAVEIFLGPQYTFGNIIFSSYTIAPLNFSYLIYLAAIFILQLLVASILFFSGAKSNKDLI